MFAGRSALGALLAASLVLVGCASKDSVEQHAGSYQPLLLSNDWQSVSRDADPFVTNADDAPACIGSGFRVETDYDWLEIDTGLCHWVTLSGPARAPVSRGQMLKLTISHYDLDAAAPAEAHMSLHFDDCEVWKKSVPIPSPAAVDDEKFASPCELSKAGKVLFHLDNHGQNTYQLQDISSLR